MSEPPVHTGVDDVHAHPHKTGHRWLDMIIAVSAISISVISLFVAIEHGRTEEKLVAANSWPFLVFESEEDGLERGARTIDLRVRNSGVGPARIQSVEIRLDGQPVRDRRSLMARCCGGVPSDNLGQTSVGLIAQNPIVGVLAARDAVHFLGWREKPGNERLWAGLETARSRLAFSACYCSVLDDCWRTDLKPTTRPTPVKDCAPTADGYIG